MLRCTNDFGDYFRWCENVHSMGFIGTAADRGAVRLGGTWLAAGAVDL